jgi:3-oxoisoapionate decarboxylase
MRLGISSYTYSWAVGVPGYPPADPLRPLDILKKARELGVRVVQIIDNLPLLPIPPAELDAFRQRAEETGISLEVGTRGVQPEQMRTYLGLARRLGSSIVRTMTETDDQKPSAEEVVANLREVLPEYEQARVYIAIENHDRLSVRVLARILERLGSPYAGVCLDTVNSFGALEGVEIVVDTLAPWVVNLHVKDFWIQRYSHQMGFTIEGRPAGRGRLNVPWILDRLSQAGRDPNAILEVWTPMEATLPETIAKDASWAKASVEYLRTLIPE